MPTKVTSREMRAHWGRYLGQVREGEIVAVTYRGETVAILKPLGSSEGSPLERFLACRDARAWKRAYKQLDALPASQRNSPRVRQQLGFILNRDGKSEEAEKVLREVLEKDGPSPETCGNLGRVYKDRWEAAHNAGRTEEARALLDQAIETYLLGHDADPENTYPGINALTLMSFLDSPHERRPALLKKLSEVVDAREEAPDQQYWDHATRLELSVHRNDAEEARDALGDSMAADKVVWMAESTSRNLSLLRQAKEERGEPVPEWLGFVESALDGVVEQVAATGDAEFLEKIEGIGPKIAGLLHAAGINTFTDLANADADELRQILRDGGPGYGFAVPDTWPEQAALAAAGRWRELDELQEELIGGRRLT